MKKFFLILISLILFVIPISYADGYDTNVIIKGSSADNGTANLYKYWVYSKTTGTRYVLRVYDWNTGKYIAVPKEYYINHIASGKNEVMYLGVDKSSDGSYTAVRSGKTIFTDTTYSHVIKWFNNNDVKNFGLTKNDIDLLAQIIKESATKNGNIALANSMQDVIDGIVPYDVRAEILFLMKVPGTGGKQRTAQVTGAGSVENYIFTFYENKKGLWRQFYGTYLEIKAMCYNFSDDCGITMKAYWLDKVACALYEDDYEYVFANDVYQCSCDLHKRMYGSEVVYKLNSSNKITLNKTAYQPGNKSDRWYMYFTPGRCGIPINVSGIIYYLTPGKTYTNLNGKKVKIDSYIKYSDTKNGIKAQDTDYLGVVTSDATHATIYEGWDYITNNLAATLVIAVDKDTGNIINFNGIKYSKYESVREGSYDKNAWEIDGYKYLGYITKDDFSLPNVPVGVEGIENTVNINITSEDVAKGVKKQIIFVYEQDDEESSDKEVRVSIYNMQDGMNFIMYSGKYSISEENVLSVNLYDRSGSKKYSKEESFDLVNGYNVNTSNLENVLGINLEEFEYLGNLVKTHEEYFLSYLGEELLSNSGDVYNLKDIGDKKVHIILGYMPKDTGMPGIPGAPVEGNPELKISYVDDKGNPLPNKESKITKEVVGKDIVSKAEDFKSEYYMYIGYTYIDTQNNFGNIVSPITIIGKDENVTTKFNTGNDRRHITFIYRKIEIEFEIDVIMEPDDLENQLIGQKENEDYWVLDEAGKVVLKITVTGTEGLNILNYGAKLRIPFDTFMNGSFVKANSINNLTVNDLLNVIVADRLLVPVWVEEKEYIIDVAVEANVEGFGVVSANKKDNVEVVGRLYDFTITNLDGSEQTGDEKWKGSLFASENDEYKAKLLPIGQKDNQPEKYNYGIKLGTTFYFSLNTKGLRNDSISITPKFLYVTEDGKTVKEVDVYVNDNGTMKNILDEDLSDRYMKLRDDNILKDSVIKEVTRAQLISKILDRYNYSTNTSSNVGDLSNITISKFLSLPYLNYINEFKSLYGVNAIELSSKTENELLVNASHWYAKYVVPASAKVVDKDASMEEKGYENGYLIVCFKIISLDSSGNEYLSYNLPDIWTQWQRESLNQNINLPTIKGDITSEKQVSLDTLNAGYAPVVIYQVGVSTKDNNTSIGTH